MNRTPVLVVTGVLALAAACGRGAPAAWSPVPESSRVYYDNSGGIQDSLRTVVRDAATLATVWRQATSRQSAPPAQPAVDFDREMLLLVAAGRKTPEDQIRVDSVAVRRERDASGRTEEFLAVAVRTVVGCRRFRADAYPLEIVRVRRYAGDVRFVERRAPAEGCP
jgi:hypothetical protein